MDGIIQFPNCNRFPLKVQVTIIGAVHMAFGFLGCMDFLVFVIESQIRDYEHMKSIFDYLRVIMFHFTMSTNIIFSIYLLYAVIGEPIYKSGLVMAWLIYTYVSTIVNIIELLETSFLLNKFQPPYFVHETIMISLQICALIIVQKYYKTLNKYSQTYSTNGSLVSQSCSTPG